ncbi:MAG: hypothetical protein ABIH24_04605 [Verrucomicrobiota bacterium]
MKSGWQIKIVGVLMIPLLVGCGGTRYGTQDAFSSGAQIITGATLDAET